MLGAILDKRIRGLLVPYVAFLLLISGLGHKEWRFVIYSVPAFNIAAARGANWLYVPTDLHRALVRGLGTDALEFRISRKKSSLIGRLSYLAVAAMLGANCLATFLLARSACANYPGGASLYAFNQLLASEHNGSCFLSLAALPR